MRISLRLALLTVCELALSGAALGAPPAAPATSFNAQNSNEVFQKNTTGGIHQILANDPKDKALIAAIRSYVQAEATRFGAGDYGKGPGIAYLNTIKQGHLHVVYRLLLTGAAVDYIGDDGTTIDAVHKWFDAEIDAQP